MNIPAISSPAFYPVKYRAVDPAQQHAEQQAEQQSHAKTMNAGQPEINRQAHPQQAPDNTYRQAEIHPRSSFSMGIRESTRTPFITSPPPPPPLTMDWLKNPIKSICMEAAMITKSNKKAI